jgi:hypothetical protein
MDESESKKQNPNEGQRRLDPELLKKSLRCDLDQYDMLKRCHEKRDMTEWNEWRKDGQWDQQRGYKDEDIHLEGAKFSEWYLKGALLSTDTTIGVHGKVYLKDANFMGADLEHAELDFAHLEGANFNNAILKGASLYEARLQGAHLHRAHLEGVNLRFAHLESAGFSLAHLEGAQLIAAQMANALLQAATVDGSTLIWKCEVNRRSSKQDGTDFSGVGLNNARIDPGTKQLLEYNIRRMNWEDWYKQHLFLTWPVRLFWSLSDYGLSTWRIIIWFFGLAAFFATIYANCACWWPGGIVSNLTVEPHSPIWHYFLLLLLRPIYFSVVTMTTLGFGDMYANTQSIWGHVLLTVQVILGYVLLGALVTRFAVLFTAGGPAGRFADETNKKDKRQKKAE